MSKLIEERHYVHVVDNTEEYFTDYTYKLVLDDPESYLNHLEYEGTRVLIQFIYSDGSARYVYRDSTISRELTELTSEHTLFILKCQR